MKYLPSVIVLLRKFVAFHIIGYISTPRRLCECIESQPLRQVRCTNRSIELFYDGHLMVKWGPDRTLVLCSHRIKWSSTWPLLVMVACWTIGLRTCRRFRIYYASTIDHSYMAGMVRYWKGYSGHFQITAGVSNLRGTCIQSSFTHSGLIEDADGSTNRELSGSWSYVI